MPHRSESGKIITSKTPLLSSHSTKISNHTSNSEQQPEPVRMKNKTNKNKTPSPEQLRVSNRCQQQQKTATQPEPAQQSNGEVVEHSSVINGKAQQPLEKKQPQVPAPLSLATTGSGGDSNGVGAVPVPENNNEDNKVNINYEEEEDGGEESPSLKNGFLHFHPSIKELCDVPCRKDFINNLDSGSSKSKKIYRVVLTGGKLIFSI